MDRSQVALIIPARNEAATISNVVASIERYGHVIVVDDESTDETGAKARNAGALVLRNSYNKKYDGSLDAGMQCALEKGYEFALTFDADGQHDASDLMKMLAALAGGADIVVGIRPRAARFSEWLFRVFGNFLWGVQDPLCGMKAYRLCWLRRYGKFDSYQSIGTELTLRMICDGALLHQVSINIHSRSDRPRFGGRLGANLKILRALAIGIWRYWVLPSRVVLTRTP